MLVDFHCHSTASDGTYAPKEIAYAARNFYALALTDHDNTDGIDELLSCNTKRVPRFFSGTELSIEPGKGFDKFHLLAINIDVNNNDLKKLLRQILDGRNERNKAIINNFKRLGFEMEIPNSKGLTIHDYAHGEVLARPHFARWLMDFGAVTSITEAFEKYLLPTAARETRCYEERFHPPQESTFETIHKAGGLAIMAHPRYWSHKWKTTPIDYENATRELCALREKGLDGLEALYEANTIEENIAFSRSADNARLLKSAGSDFHGSNKPTISLGMNVSEDFISPLLERLGL